MRLHFRHIALALMAAVAVVMIGVGLHGVFGGDGPEAVEPVRFAAWGEADPSDGSGDELADEGLPDKVVADDALRVGQNAKRSKKTAPKVEIEDSLTGEFVGDSEAKAKAEPATKKKPKPVAKPKPSRTPPVKKVDWKPAVLEIVTNFDQADVTVNGIAYPEYTKPGEPTGVVLPAGGPYWVEVKSEGNTKNYEVYLRPYETRLLLVDLTGFSGKGPRRVNQPSVPEPRKEEKEEEDEEKGPGKVTVYSKPPGIIMVDGEKSSDKTPGTLEIENGRHEIQVEYDGGGVSEKKIVRVREGSRIKLFFRKRN